MSIVSRARVVNLGLLVLAALAVWATFWTKRLPTSAETEVRRHHLLPVFRQEDVQRLLVVHGSQRTLLTRRPPAPAIKAREVAVAEAASKPEQQPEQQPEPDTELAEAPPSEDDPLTAEWSLLEPFETDADALPVEKLLGTLRYATWEREVPGPLELGTESAEAGAVFTERAIELTMGKVSYRLRLGKDSVSPPGSRYLEVTSGAAPSHVYVVKKGLVEALFVEGEAFRGRQIVPYRKSSVERLTLSSAAGVRRLKRVGADFHFDGMQEEQRAERASVERIFVALARAVAQPFLDVEVAKAALSVDASVRVSLQPSAEKAEASLEFGGTCPTDPQKTVAVRHVPEPLAGCVERSVLLGLREPAGTLIDRGLFGLNADEVEVVRLEEGEQVLDFARDGEGFTLRQPRSVALDADAAKDRVARILGIVGEVQLGRAKPRGGDKFAAALVTLESSSRLGQEPIKETVRVGPPLSDGSRYVFRDADGAVLRVSAEDAIALRADATLLKQNQVFDYAIKDVRRVKVVAGPVRQTLDRTANGALSLSEPPGYAVDGGLAVDLIDQLRTLRALRWVSDRTATGFGLEKPRAELQLNVEVEGQPIERTLRIGRSAPGGYYASVDRDPGVFVAPHAIERLLGTWLFDRSVFAAERDSIVELTLKAEGRGSISLRRVAGQLTLQKGSTPLDDARLDDLLETIESLRPEAAVHTGPATPGEGLRRPILSGFIRRQSPQDIGLPPIRFNIGSRDSFHDASIYYARHASVNATYALPREQVQRLLDLF